MPRKMSDEEFALLPPERQKVILYDRERTKKNKEQRQEKKKVYYENNKKTISEKGKIYYQNNKEQRKEYVEANKEHIKVVRKAYNQTDSRIKDSKISNWKASGFKHTPEQFEAIYERYCATNECDICSAPMIARTNHQHTKCADHDHSSGCFRNVVCRKCNGMRLTQDIARMKMLIELHRRFVQK